MKTIYIRKLKYENAKKKFLQEIEQYFCKGETIIQVIHGIGNLKLKKMILQEIKKIDYLQIMNNENLIYNSGVTFIQLIVPEKSLLKQYLL